MSPKKAIIIILALFLIVFMIFGFLYLRKQIADSNNELIDAGTGTSSGGVIKKEPPKPSEIIEEKVNKIVEEAKNNPSASTPAEVRQDIISTINAEIIKQENSKTPEQTAADLKAAEERQKVIDQINNQIRQGSQ